MNMRKLFAAWKERRRQKKLLIATWRRCIVLASWGALTWIEAGVAQRIYRNRDLGFTIKFLVNVNAQRNVLEVETGGKLVFKVVQESDGIVDLKIWVPGRWEAFICNRWEMNK